MDKQLAKYGRGAMLATEPQVSGHLVRMVGLTLEAVGLKVTVGSRCEILVPGQKSIETEVVGFEGEKIFLMPIMPVSGLQPGAVVRPLPQSEGIQVGAALIGRVINGVGEPIDGLGPIKSQEYVNQTAPIINPLDRKPICETLDVGIRAINSLITVGKGQRLGLFAGSGVGKSVLLGMMTRLTTADIVVVGLIGERGREVKEFIQEILGPDGLKRAIVIASPADDSALMRLRAAELSTRIAEYFRDTGANVLLLMDSLTRYAQAQREVALAIGEPPATKGYPPSVFAKLPALVERAGNGDENSGSVTAFYTVLTEGDDLQDPIADSARAILDGHVVLARSLAEEGHYPAIDIEASISRAMPQIVTSEHLSQAQRLKQLYARYQQNRDLINVGAYVAGSDPETDIAIQYMPLYKAFLQQSMAQGMPLAQCIDELGQLVSLGTQQAEPEPQAQG